MKTFWTVFGIIGLITNSYAASSQSNSIISMLPMLLAFASITYFMLIRPQYKQQQKLSKLIAGIKTEDKIKLSSGIIGTIKTIEEQYITLEVADKVTITVDKLSVMAVLPKTNDSL